MSLARGRCVICTSNFTSNNISALHCGHTFHFVCISEWVKRSKTCPICRVTTAERHIVKHIYFDSADDISASQTETSSAAKVLDTEKKCYREKIPSLQARNRQLEMMLVDQQELQKTLERTKSRLQACEFYKAVTTAKDDSAMDKYLRDDGGVEFGQFLKVLRGQLEDSRKSQQKLRDDLSAERELVRTLKKKEDDLKNIVTALEKELRDVRCAANIDSTPFNPKLRGLDLRVSPPKRDSMGFNVSVEINTNVLNSALGRRARAVSPRRRPDKSPVRVPIFLNLSDDDDEQQPAAADVSLQYPAQLDTIPSPRIPKTMRERMLNGGSENKRPTGLGGAQDAPAKALVELEIRNASANTMSRKPLVLKRKLDKTDPNNQRLSQFFPKRNPTDVIVLDD
ncbi:zinc finger, C3HC4 type [Cooperia oncophora]